MLQLEGYGLKRCQTDGNNFEGLTQVNAKCGINGLPSVLVMKKAKVYVD